MKQFIALSLLSLAQSVRGHGYLTIPHSRSRLGFEVSPFCILLPVARPPGSNTVVGWRRQLPRMQHPRARPVLARPRRRRRREEWTVRVQRPRGHRLQPALRRLGQRARSRVRAGPGRRRPVVRRSQWRPRRDVQLPHLPRPKPRGQVPHPGLSPYQR